MHQGSVEPSDILRDHGVLPIIVLPALKETDLNKEALENMLEEAQIQDDVFSDEFCRRAVLQIPSGSSPQLYEHKVRSYGLFHSIFHKVPGNMLTSNLPAPYFLQGTNIHQAWRLYEDKVDAFVIPLLPEKVTESSR